MEPRDAQPCEAQSTACIILAIMSKEMQSWKCRAVFHTSMPGINRSITDSVQKSQSKIDPAMSCKKMSGTRHPETELCFE
jgi:hypothetical protein